MAIDQFIYLLENDNKIVHRLQEAIPNYIEGHKLFHFPDFTSALRAIERTKPDIILLSMDFNRESTDFDTFSFIEVLKEHFTTYPMHLIILGNRQDLRAHKNQLEERALPSVPKPLRLPLLVETLEETVQQINLERNRSFNLESGDTLFSKGDQADSVYILSKGKLEVYDYTATGEKVLFKVIEEEEIVGELSMVDGSQRSAYVRALEDCQLIRLEVGDINAYLREQPYWLRLFMKTIIHRLRDANQKIIELNQKK